MKKPVFLAGILVLAALRGVAVADLPFSIQLNLGAPPLYGPAVVAPSMFWVPQLGMYAAYGSSYPIFYYGSSYYYLYGGRWYAGPDFRGPWRPIVMPPPALQRWQPGEWRGLQGDMERYRQDPHWRHFRADRRYRAGPGYRGPEGGRQNMPGYYQPPMQGYGPHPGGVPPMQGYGPHPGGVRPMQGYGPHPGGMRPMQGYGQQGGNRRQSGYRRSGGGHPHPGGGGGHGPGGPGGGHGPGGFRGFGPH